MGDAALLTALAGGVGASKLLVGLKHVLSPRVGTAIVNTADDEEFYGLHVSPDLDSVVYSLSGLADDVRGWGVGGDSFNALEMLGRLGCETWFKLGDRDLAVHIYRTMRLRQGATLTQATTEIAGRLGAGWQVLPMTDDRVRTMVSTEKGLIPFQEYFVKHSHGLRFYGVKFEGVEKAKPTKAVIEALEKAESIVICPSNPVVSIGPILALEGVKQKLSTAEAKVLAVSPIVGGRALRGPAADMMSGLGLDPSPAGVATLYRDFLDVLVLDSVDSAYVDEVRALGVKPVVADIVMNTLEDKVRLAKTVVRELVVER
ncbi:MAG: 2-phospho-L-lactate transferase [Candidatus Caldarchaeum sp.]|nr:2-phospho-L-lactate transferase [Candidatus Caldarchaeum sp.]